MDQLVHDFNTALDETAGSNSSSRSSASRRKSWKRRCKSTSNLNTGNNISDDSSSSVDNIGLLSRDRGTSSLQFSDSDLEASGSIGTMVRQGRSRTKRGRGDIIMGIESDSFTENVQPWQDFRAHTRRRRKFKRMAIGTSLEVGCVRDVTAVKRKKVRSRSGYEGGNLDPKFAGGITPGKRKRSAREKSVEGADILGGDRNSRLRTVSLGDNNDKMELEDASSSSSLSSSEWEDVDNCPEGEADDEQSDWPGHDTGLTDEELDTEISFNTRKLLSGGRDRVVRAGSRKLKTGERHQPPYGEMMHRFIKDNSLQSLRMTSVKSSDRNMIFSLARMYNLSVVTDLSTVTVTKASGGPHRHMARTEDSLTEFAVPGVPQLRSVPGGYRDPGGKESNKKQRKYGPPPISESSMAGPSSGVVTRHQQAAGSRHRSYTAVSPSTIGSQSN